MGFLMISGGGGGSTFTGGTLTSPLILAAGTTTVKPLQFQSGTNLTTPVSGVMEYDGTNLFYTDSTPTRRTLVYSGMSGDLYSQYALLAGRSGGQILKGGSGVTDTLTLVGTSGTGTATAAAINLNVGTNGGTNAITVLNNGKVGIGVAAPAEIVEINGNIRMAKGMVVNYLRPSDSNIAPILTLSGSANTTILQGNVGTGGGNVLSLGLYALTAGMGITITGLGYAGINTATPSYILSLSGAAACTIGVERNPTADTAGVLFTLQGSGATSGATNKTGGGIAFKPGISTGNAAGTAHTFYTNTAGGTGTTDQAQAASFSILNNQHIYFGTVVTDTYNVTIAALDHFTIGMERMPTLNTAGKNFYLAASGAAAGATNKDGGVLALYSGKATGTGVSTIKLYAYGGGSTGTSDVTATNIATFSHTGAAISGGLTITGAALFSPGSGAGGVQIQPTVGFGATEHIFNVLSYAGNFLIDMTNDDKLSFFNIASPIAQPSGLTQLTYTTDGTDYAIQDAVSGGYGFVTAAEAQTFIKIVANTQAQLKALGLFS